MIYDVGAFIWSCAIKNHYNDLEWEECESLYFSNKEVFDLFERKYEFDPSA